MSEVSQIPKKARYQLREVCRYTDTQPYVLLFWESEFQQLKPGRGKGGQAVYTRDDIDLILRIKQLLHEEEQTLDGARQILARESQRTRKGGKRAGSSRKSGPSKTDGPRAVVKPPKVVVPDSDDKRRGTVVGGPEALGFDTVPRERYEDAVEEVSHLRFELKEAEAGLRKAETQLDRARGDADQHRKRSLAAAERLEKLLESLE